MTTASDPASGDEADAIPYLPPARPVATGALSAVTDGCAAAASHGLEATNDVAGSSDAPFVPEPVPVAAPPTAEPAFDAKAMVESQRRVTATPGYGAMPSGSETSREASAELRAKAARQRRRNKRISGFVGLVVLGGITAGAWFVYGEYRSDQTGRAVERTEASEGAGDDALVDDDAALTPVGEQLEIIAAQDALDGTARMDVGGLGRAVDQARDVVGRTNGDADAEGGTAGGVSGAPPLTVDDLLPPAVVEIGERLPDLSGRETYLVVADDFATADSAAYSRFLRAMANQPQSAPGSLAAEGVPQPATGEIVISVERDGDLLARALVVGGSDLGVAVDYQP